MSKSRKFCLYKGCDNAPGRTLFRFPVDKERFCVWAQNAGLDLKGDVNISEARFLCEKHFSSKYISMQSRRKMLVFTAVPEKFDEEIETPEVNFNIVGQSAEKKRKPQFPSRDSVGDNQINATPIILNNQKRKLDDSINSNDETIEMIDSDSASIPSNHIVYEEVVIPPPAKRSFKCVVVKQKKPASTTKTIMNYIQPSSTQNDDIKEEETFFLTEEGNISSTKTEQKETEMIEEEEEEEVQLSPTYPKKSASVENYSEFIFNGEIYVQMPKRVFDAEKEKIRAENVKYKAMLMKLKKQIDELLES